MNSKKSGEDKDWTARLPLCDCAPLAEGEKSVAIMLQDDGALHRIEGARKGISVGFATWDNSVAAVTCYVEAEGYRGRLGILTRDAERLDAIGDQLKRLAATMRASAAGGGTA